MNTKDAVLTRNLKSADPVDVNGFRNPEHKIAPIFLERWSPRSYTEEEIPDSVLMTCFEAARWAPSSTNQQPWRFVYCKRGGENWDNFKEAILERSRMWAQHASAVIFFVSKLAVFARGEYKISRSHAFDTGAAWENFALQATMLGWSVHAIGGYDQKNAPRLLGIPEEGWQIHCAVTIGRRGEKSFLADDFAAREHPNLRVPLNLLLMEGGFKPELTDFPRGTPGEPR
jgi:nitroreductase